MTSCGSRDAKLQKQIVGNWSRDDEFQMMLSSGGSFSSHWVYSNKSVTYQGNWKVQDASIVMELTNCIAEGSIYFARVGSVEKYSIIGADSTELVYSNNDQIISFRRK
jgi:hypothetical protein